MCQEMAENAHFSLQSAPSWVAKLRRPTLPPKLTRPAGTCECITLHNFKKRPLLESLSVRVLTRER